MTKNTATLLRPNILDANTSIPEISSWTGDSLIDNPDAEWILSTDFPVSKDELWSGRMGITRIGPGNEGYAGYLLPENLHQMVKDSKLDYVLPADDKKDSPELPRQLKVGDSIKDGNGSEKATVIILDDDTKHMLLESKWYEDTDRKPMHYTWEVFAVDGDEINSSKLITKMRMNGMKYPKTWQKIGPLADRLVMELARHTITGNTVQQNYPRKIGAAALILHAGDFATKVKSRKTK